MYMLVVYCEKHYSCVF